MMSMPERHEQTVRSTDRGRRPGEDTGAEETEETPFRRVVAGVQEWLNDVQCALTGHDRADASEPRRSSRADGGATARQEHPLLAVDSELLDPEQRITQLLLREGGRIPQSEIVERTRWTSSTVSRRLGDMESRDIVERRRFGGGKTVLLSGDADDAPVQGD